MNSININMMYSVIDSPEGDFDVIVLSDDRVLAIGASRIELWASLKDFLTADPQGDLADRIGFLEWSPECDDPIPPNRELPYRESRFGRFLIRDLSMVYVRMFAGGLITLVNDYKIVIDRKIIFLLDPDYKQVGRIK